MHAKLLRIYMSEAFNQNPYSAPKQGFHSILQRGGEKQENKKRKK